MLFMVIKNNKLKIKDIIIKIIRKFGIFNNLLNGIKMTKINPTKLLIKNRGYLEIFFQKSFIKDIIYT